MALVKGCVGFLHLAALYFDRGYSILLRREAWALGLEAEVARCLTSNPTQGELEGIFRHGAATSLDVERKIAHDKRNETARLITGARGSRNSILRRFSGVQAEAQQQRRVHTGRAGR